MSLTKNLEDKIKVFALIGHTASGKNELAFEIAKELGAKIILCDSKKVYKLMDIGTSKPTKEMRKEVDYFMIDLKYPNEYYSAGDYAKDAEKIILELAKKKERFFVVGGGTLYLKALFEEDFISLDSVSFELREKLKKEKTEKLYELLKKIDPQRAKKIGKNDRVRIERAIEIYEVTGEKPSEIYKKRKVEKKIVPYYFAIYWDNKERKKRISDRLDKMMKIGFLEEVENLLRNGYDLRYKSLDAHGYKELILYLTGKIRSLEEAMALTKKRIYEYTKRQLRFFRNYLKIKPIFYKMEEGNRNFIKEKLKRVLEEEIWKDF